MTNFDRLLAGSPRAVLFAMFMICSFAHAGYGEVLHVTPTGNGRQDGSNWENAATLDKLSALIRTAGSGGSVWLRADSGPYRPSAVINVRAGGVQNNPVTIKGVDISGRPMRAEIVGTRADPYDPAGAQGSEVFRLLDGANSLKFEYFYFRNVGNGAFRIADTISDLAIQHVQARNVTRFIENNISGTAVSAVVKGLTVRDTQVIGFSRGAIRLRYDSSDILFEDVEGDSEHQDGANFAIGVHLDETVHDVVLRRVVMKNARDTLNEYQNGDGFSTEEGTYNIRFEDTVASGNTDAGYDLKSADTILLRTTAQGNKRNYRIWGTATIQDCVGISPHKNGGIGSQTQVWVGRKGQASLESCALSDDDPSTVVFHVEDLGSLIVSDVVVSKNRDAEMSRVEPGASLIGCCSATP